MKPQSLIFIYSRKCLEIKYFFSLSLFSDYYEEEIR